MLHPPEESKRLQGSSQRGACLHRTSEVSGETDRGPKPEGQRSSIVRGAEVSRKHRGAMRRSVGPDQRLRLGASAAALPERARRLTIIYFVYEVKVETPARATVCF